MFIVKLRSTGGPHVQRGLKGNTITFPQNVIRMVPSLPANPNILSNHIRVIFIGTNFWYAKTNLTVWQEKIMAELDKTFLILFYLDYVDPCNGH